MTQPRGDALARRPEEPPAGAYVLVFGQVDDPAVRRMFGGAADVTTRSIDRPEALIEAVRRLAIVGR